MHVDLFGKPLNYGDNVIYCRDSNSYDLTTGKITNISSDPNDNNIKIGDLTWRKPEQIIKITDK